MLMLFKMETHPLHSWAEIQKALKIQQRWDRMVWQQSQERIRRRRDVADQIRQDGGVVMGDIARRFLEEHDALELAYANTQEQVVLYTEVDTELALEQLRVSLNRGLGVDLDGS